MMIPPFLMRLKVVNREHDLNLWLPLVLAWLLLGVLALALAPLVLLVALLAWPFGWGKPLLLLGPHTYTCLCALRDLRIDMRRGADVTLVYFL